MVCAKNVKNIFYINKGIKSGSESIPSFYFSFSTKKDNKGLITSKENSIIRFTFVSNDSGITEAFSVSLKTFQIYARHGLDISQESVCGIKHLESYDYKTNSKVFNNVIVSIIKVSDICYSVKLQNFRFSVEISLDDVL